ncbi:hypothetical protein ACIRQF_31575 [Streptomyces sp. NPDC101191]|uniref:hypothetical protein n=1 Tax=Streptomyces sp. NPDC101191 TaxID=3366126 RepID=UPI0038116B5D
MAERAQRGPDRLLADVERIIEDHLPGGSFGVDARSMTQAIVRPVRRIETAVVAGGLNVVTRRIAPRQAGAPDGEDHASARGGRGG